jgi:hypothetical protein
MAWRHAADTNGRHSEIERWKTMMSQASQIWADTDSIRELTKIKEYAAPTSQSRLTVVRAAES